MLPMLAAGGRGVVVCGRFEEEEDRALRPRPGDFNSRGRQTGEASIQAA